MARPGKDFGAGRLSTVSCSRYETTSALAPGLEARYNSRLSAAAGAAFACSTVGCAEAAATRGGGWRRTQDRRHGFDYRYFSRTAPDSPGLRRQSGISSGRDALDLDLGTAALHSRACRPRCERSMSRPLLEGAAATVDAHDDGATVGKVGDPQQLRIGSVRWAAVMPYMS